MGSVPTLLKQRWNSKILAGAATHCCLVRIRQGYMNHFYQPVEILPTSPGPGVQIPTIWKGNNGSPWQGQWQVTGDWINLQNIQSASWTRDFQDNGASTLTVVMDNIAFINTIGAAGLYHVIQRGWFSPTRGVKVKARPTLWESNEWANVFNGGYQIELWEGYGQGTDSVPVLDEGTNEWSAPAASKTWAGIIENCDMESHPDHVTLTCTDFCVMLTDQRVMGQNKAPECQSPITFADRKKVLGETKAYGSPSVSSGRYTIDSHLGVIWESAANSGSANTEWIELKLQKGFYRDFYVALPYDGETMYISIYAQGTSTMDGTTPVSGWVDVSLGDVPGTTIPYLAVHNNTVSDPSRRWSFGGHTFNLGDGSKLRISFRNLSKDIDQPPDVDVPTSPGYRAGTNSFYTFRFGTDPSKTNNGIKAQNWILVDDAADVVRMVLLWAGFKEMNVEEFGWTLAAPLVYGQDSFFIDIINDILAQGNYCFFMDAPTDHDMSIGVPTFQAQTATKPATDDLLTIKDTVQLEALQVTTDLSNLPYVIRWRGAQTSQGVTLFADLVKRWMGTYWPPWSGHDYTNLQGRNFQGTFPEQRGAGVRRHFSQTNTSLSSVAECLFACILTAVQYALQAYQGTLQIAGYPGITLNQQIVCIDEATGTNTRVWPVSITSTHNLGANGSWHMSIGGAVIDTEDMDLIADDYKYTYQRYVISKAGS